MEINKDWSQLFSDLLSLIVGKLSIIDKIRFGCVCTHWHKVSKSTNPKPSSPWLMFKSLKANSIDFFSITDEDNNNKIYTIQGMCPRYDIGSSHGWLITSDIEYNMYLRCPLTGVEIPLPPNRYMSFITKWGKQFESWKHCEMHRIYIKAVLLAAPTLSLDDKWEFTVMMIYNQRRNVAFTRGGEKRWTKVKNLKNVVDILSCDGKFYALKICLEVVVLDSNGKTFEARLVAPKFKRSGTPEFIDFMAENPEFLDRDVTICGSYYNIANGLGCFRHRYLVKCLDGKLLVLLRGNNHYQDEYCTKRFKILAWEEQEVKWKHLMSLGDQVIVVGKNNSLCLSAAGFPELRPNSIYYNQFYLSGYHYSGQFLWNDIGVFYMEEKKTLRLEYVGVLEERYTRSDSSCLSWKVNFPFWFTPN